MSALELRGLSKRFGPRWVLSSVDFSLPEGRSLLLTGHNGSGKTTLLRIIATATSPSAGVVSVFGKDCVHERDQVRDEVALFSHSSFLYEDLTGEQNLTTFARLLGLPDAKTKAEAALNRVGLGQRGANPVRQYSAGMRKRLGIARLLLKAPRLALLDEPFGELDPDGIQQMEGIIRELQAKGTSVVLATHHIAQGQGLTNERLHLDAGRKAAP